MAYTPMPSHLDLQLQNVVREISSAQADAGNTIFVIREALAQAYATGHKDAHNQAMSHQWLTEDLKKTFDARKAALKAAKDSAHKVQAKDEDHD